MFCFFFFKQKTAYEMRISDWSSDVCSSDLLEYLVKGSGPLTIAAGYGGAFYRADGAQGRPDTQAYLLLFSTDRMGTRLTPDSSFMTSAYQLRPKSRGSIRLARQAPRAAPIIHPCYPSDADNCRLVLHAFKSLSNVMGSPPMAPQ